MTVPLTLDVSQAVFPCNEVADKSARHFAGDIAWTTGWMHLLFGRGQLQRFELWRSATKLWWGWFLPKRRRDSVRRLALQRRRFLSLNLCWVHLKQRVSRFCFSGDFIFKLALLKGLFQVYFCLGFLSKGIPSPAVASLLAAKLFFFSSLAQRQEKKSFRVSKDLFWRWVDWVNA